MLKSQLCMSIGAASLVRLSTNVTFALIIPVEEIMLTLDDNDSTLNKNELGTVYSSDNVI